MAVRAFWVNVFVLLFSTLSALNSPHFEIFFAQNRLADFTEKSRSGIFHGQLGS